MIKKYSNNPDFNFDFPGVMTDEEKFAIKDTILDYGTMVNVDILFVDNALKSFILTERQAQPAEGLWFVGGNKLRNLGVEESALAVVKRETGTVLDPDKLKYFATGDFFWDDRGKFDVNKRGRVDLNICFTYEPTTEELASMTADLDTEEYDKAKGYKLYDRDAIKAYYTDNPGTLNEEVLLDYYDMYFADK